MCQEDFVCNYDSFQLGLAETAWKVIIPHDKIFRIGQKIQGVVNSAAHQGQRRLKILYVSSLRHLRCDSLVLKLIPLMITRHLSCWKSMGKLDFFVPSSRIERILFPKYESHNFSPSLANLSHSIHLWTNKSQHNAKWNNDQS